MNLWKNKIKAITKSDLFPYILLLVISLAVGYAASEALSVNADAVIYPYLFKDFQPDQLIFSEQHSNLIKFPLFFLQSILPYNYFSFTIVNLLLFTVTTLGLLFVGTKILGKKYSLHISITLGTLLVLSPLLANNLIYTTVRNIEFPIIVWVIYELSRYISGERKLPRIWFFIAFLTLVILLAGDFYFAYVAIAPILASLVLLLLLHFKTHAKKRMQYLLSILFLGISALVAKLLQKALDIAGLYDTNTNYLNASEPVSNIKEFIFSLDTATHQLFSLFSANTATLGGITVGILVSLLLVAGITGIVLYIVKNIKKSPISAQVISSVLILATITGCFMVYVISGLTFIKSTDGNLLPVDGTRYLTFIPLLLIFTIPFAVKFFSKDTIQRNSLITASFILILVGTIYSTKERLDQHETVRNQQLAYVDLGNKLKDEGVTNVLIGYWTAPMLEFWSEAPFEYAIVAECNLPSIDNARRDWYEPDASQTQKSALVISMQGGDLPFLGYCPADKLQTIYGAPNKTGSFSKKDSSLSQVNLWFYNYDIRSKLRPLPLP